MRTIRYLLQKEFRQIFRNRTILAMIIVMPVVQLIILPLTADYEVKNVNLAVVDHDRSPLSAKLLSKITASGYFRLAGYNYSYAKSLALLETDKADLILEIPSGFEENVQRGHAPKLSVAVNAINGAKASLGGSYLVNIIRASGFDMVKELMPAQKFSPSPQLEITNSYWFNPYMITLWSM